MQNSSLCSRRASVVIGNDDDADRLVRKHWHVRGCDCGFALPKRLMLSILSERRYAPKLTNKD